MAAGHFDTNAILSAASAAERIAGNVLEQISELQTQISTLLETYTTQSARTLEETVNEWHGAAQRMHERLEEIVGGMRASATNLEEAERVNVANY